MDVAVVEPSGFRPERKLGLPNLTTQSQLHFSTRASKHSYEVDLLRGAKDSGSSESRMDLEMEDEGRIKVVQEGVVPDYVFDDLERREFATVTYGSISVSVRGNGAVMMQKGGDDSKKASTPWVPDPVIGYYKLEGQTSVNRC
ncbi:unnamed protein product [Lactuca virosa]|uniref:Uncharacterized protein n=1 Tax=Lactuca virosa TaxID=75947 RepID=A0AAU9P754_9ASTR|nr:unnamed protein product [Lactuca virosa]